MSMLADESLAFHLDDNGLASLILFLGTSLLELHLSLGPVDGELFLPQALDLSFMFLFAHPSLLCVHLFKALILSELVRQLCLELILHASLLSLSLFLQALLVCLSCEEIVSYLLTLLYLLAFPLTSLLFQLLHIKIVTQILDVFSVSTTLLLLALQLLEDLLSSSLSFSLLGLNFSLSALLLLSVPSEHLIFVFFKFFLLPDKLTLLVDGLNHVEL